MKKINRKKYLEQKYSIIEKEDYLFNNKKIIPKLIELSDFKIRKHYKKKNIILEVLILMVYLKKVKKIYYYSIVKKKVMNLLKI